MLLSPTLCVCMCVKQSIFDLGFLVSEKILVLAKNDIHNATFSYVSFNLLMF